MTSLRIPTATAKVAFTASLLLATEAIDLGPIRLPEDTPQQAGKTIVTSKLSWVNDQAKQLAALKDNWDGYGATPVSIDRLNVLISHLERTLPAGSPAGFIVPGADGSIQAEWHLKSGSFGFLLEDGADISTWYRAFGSKTEIAKSGLLALELLRAAVLHAMS